MRLCIRGKWKVKRGRWGEWEALILPCQQHVYALVSRPGEMENDRE